MIKRVLTPAKVRVLPLHVHPYSTYASGKGSDETARLRLHFLTYIYDTISTDISFVGPIVLPLIAPPTNGCNSGSILDLRLMAYHQ